jgi:hypothetical protein
VVDSGHDGTGFECLFRRERADPGEVARMLALGVAESDDLAPLAIQALAEAGLRAAAGTATATFAGAWPRPCSCSPATSPGPSRSSPCCPPTSSGVPARRRHGAGRLRARGEADRRTLRACAGIKEPEISRNRHLFDLIKTDRDRAGRRQAAEELAAAARARFA